MLLRPVESGLYVSICVVAALTALPESDSPGHLLWIIWGITIGLALAHWFAFRLATRLVSAGDFGSADIELAAAQLVGAASVAILASIPVILLPESVELEATELLLAGFVGVVGYTAMRGSGATRGRAMLYGLAVLLTAATIVVLKNWLAGH